MKNLKKISYLSACALFTVFVYTPVVSAQERPRLVKTISSQPTNQPQTSVAAVESIRSSSKPLVTNAPGTRPVLTNKIVVDTPSLVRKTGATSPVAAITALAAGKMAYGSPVSSAIMRGIQSRLGIPYLYGSSGPNRYDCSGFVWSVFGEAGISFARSSARNLWAMSEPVAGDERFKFGTLVFLNGLGHMGIVADEKGFYHASSSKGVTYSTFDGYWGSRITGFRKLSQSVSLP